METRDALRDNSEVEVDLKKLFLFFLNRWWFFAVSSVVVAAAVLAYTAFAITPLYRASTSLFVNNRSQQVVDAQYVSSSDIYSSRYLVETYMAITSSDRVANRVSEVLDDRYTPEELKSMISVSQMEETEVFTITVKSPDPVESAEIANALAEVVPEVIASIVEGSSARVVDYAEVPTHRSSPSFTRNTILGAIIGFLIAGVYLVLVYVLDVRIKDEEDITSIVDYPVLGQIPEFEMIGKRSEHKNKYAYSSSSTETKGQKEGSK